MPLIEMKVQPQQTMIAEEGAFAYYQDGMKMENFFNDGQPPLLRSLSVQRAKTRE